MNREDDVDEWERRRLKRLLAKAMEINLEHIINKEPNKAVRKFVDYLEEELLNYDLSGATLYDLQLKHRGLINDLAELLTKTPEYHDCYYKDDCADNCKHTSWPCMFHEVEKLINKYNTHY